MMFRRMMMGNYILVRRSTLLLGAMAAACMVGFHYYKWHHAELESDLGQIADDVAGMADVAKKGTRKVKEAVEEAVN